MKCLFAVSLSGMINEGSLFVIIIATIDGFDDSGSGLTVHLGGERPVPIGQLTGKFVTSQCTAFAERPKIFIFIDPGTEKNSVQYTVKIVFL